MPLKRVYAALTLSLTHVPQLNRAVITATGEQCPIGTKRYRPYPAIMFGKAVERFHAIHLPYTNLAVETSRRHVLPIGTQGDRGNAAECLREHRVPNTSMREIHVLRLDTL